ncbi:MAG: tRNA lysidine(34) synthetase TilS [Raoultibacter sp.]
MEDITARIGRTIADRKLATPDSAVLLMVSGGSDSVALAYIAADLAKTGALGDLAMLHVNHQLRGQASDDDQAFVQKIAELLQIPLYMCEIDIAGEAQRSGGNVEAIARHERYLAANEALESFCLHAGVPLAEGRICTAHTQDDRVENFYMRSIVGTGPGGFRSMLYANGPVVRPCLDASKEDLRTSISQRVEAGLPVAYDGIGNLWREDATNAHTDRFRAFVRHEIVPLAVKRNPQLLDTLCRTMNLIADEDDMLEAQATALCSTCVTWTCEEDGRVDYAAGCVLAPALGQEALPLQRRVIVAILQGMLGPDARVETASVDDVAAGFAAGIPVSGYTNNIQGDLAVSANKQGVLLEPMAAYRARRKKVAPIEQEESVCRE